MAKKPVKSTPKKIVKKAVKKTVRKTKAASRSHPPIFDPKSKLNIWEAPPTPASDFFANLSNLQLQYISSSMSHIQAEIALMVEARNAGDKDYTDQVSNYAFTLIENLANHFKEQKLTE